MGPKHTTSNALKECLERMKHLEDENRQLRESSRTFGELAERLKVLLREERRLAAAVRSEQRTSTVELSPHRVNDQS
jgi:cell shape-determining protein MreC